MAVVIEVNGMDSLVANPRKMEAKTGSGTVTPSQNPNDSLTKTQPILHTMVLNVRIGGLFNIQQ